MVKLDLPERLERLSSVQGAVMIRLIETVILDDEMGLTKGQIQTAKAIVAREVPRTSALRAAELAGGIERRSVWRGEDRSELKDGARLVRQVFKASRPVG